MIKEATLKLINRHNLTFEETQGVILEIMDGHASTVQTAAFLAALSTKGETIEEITAGAAGMRARGLPVAHPYDLLEIVGTGGDGSGTFNISTTASFIIAAAGVKVAKHGNRAASSRCGAADCLEALGANLSLSPAHCLRLLDEVGLCFFFAQHYHQAMRHVAPVRKELGIRTIFNLLGPLTNPAAANHQVLGVNDKALVEPLARVLANLGVVRALVVHGHDPMDEISLSAQTSVCELDQGQYRIYDLCPEDFGFKRCSLQDLQGGTPQDNARITLEILQGKKGPRKNAVLLNAAAGLYLAGEARTLQEGVTLANELICSGQALNTLKAFVKETNHDSNLS